MPSLFLKMFTTKNLNLQKKKLALKFRCDNPECFFKTTSVTFAALHINSKYTCLECDKNLQPLTPQTPREDNFTICNHCFETRAHRGHLMCTDGRTRVELPAEKTDFQLKCENCANNIVDFCCVVAVSEYGRRFYDLKCLHELDKENYAFWLHTTPPAISLNNFSNVSKNVEKLEYSLKAYAQKKHPNEISYQVRLLCSINSDNVQRICAVYAPGSLLFYPNYDCLLSNYKTQVTLSYSGFLRMAGGILNGLVSLHANRYLHRNLSDQTIVLRYKDLCPVPLLTGFEFAMSSVLHSTAPKKSTGAITATWTFDSNAWWSLDMEQVGFVFNDMLATKQEDCATYKILNEVKIGKMPENITPDKIINLCLNKSSAKDVFKILLKSFCE